MLLIAFTFTIISISLIQYRTVWFAQVTLSLSFICAWQNMVSHWHLANHQSAFCFFQRWTQGRIRCICWRCIWFIQFFLDLFLVFFLFRNKWLSQITRLATKRSSFLRFWPIGICLALSSHVFLYGNINFMSKNLIFVRPTTTASTQLPIFFIKPYVNDRKNLIYIRRQIKS